MVVTFLFNFVASSGSFSRFQINQVYHVHIQHQCCGQQALNLWPANCAPNMLRLEVIRIRGPHHVEMTWDCVQVSTKQGSSGGSWSGGG